jgi:hypothetical protein
MGARRPTITEGCEGSLPSSSTVEASVTPPDSSGIILATPR